MVTGFVDRAKGKTAINTQYMSSGASFFSNAQDNITASPSPNNTQAGALVLTQQQSRITTVATAADSVRLPPAIPGAALVVTNDAAVNAANVWPAGATQGGISGGDRINAIAQNGAFSLTVAAGPTIFYCFTLGTWRTK